MKISNLNIVYEDNHIIVVVKPPNVLSQQDYTNDLDMMTIIKEYLKEKYNKPNEAFLGMVHRLDRRVSGLMVYAKTSKAASRISANIRDHRFKKEYMAIVKGITPSDGILKNHILKTITQKGQVAEIVNSDVTDSKEAILEYHTVKTFKLDDFDYSILKINLITGRYNQIRVQLSHFNHPIINDYKYGYLGKNYDDELGLSCTKLSFDHPTKKDTIEFEYYPNQGIWLNLQEE